METTSPVMIEAQGISKYFGPFVAIEDISFSIPTGQVVAFLGPNGAGKSTAMKILTGFMAPTVGRAFIGGFDIHAERIEASRRLGYLPENGPLYMDMTPLELLRFFGEARGLSEEELKSRIDWVTEKHAIEEVLEKPIGKLSKGYRQRVGLAQALIHDPEVLIMDEPDRRARSEPDPRLPGKHSRIGFDKNDPHLDAHPPGGRCGGRSRALRKRGEAGFRRHTRGTQKRRVP